MGLIIRVLLFLATPITALFVARESLNFDIIAMMVAIMMAVGVLMAIAFWPRKSEG